jgi:hypothetical protein
MSEEESKMGEISGLQFEDATAGLPDSPDVQPDVGLSVAVVQGIDPRPELALLVNSNASQCSEDPAEMTEAYYLGRLEPEAAMLFKGHFETCSCCRQAHEETVAFVDAIRVAAKGLESVDDSKVN